MSRRLLQLVGHSCVCIRLLLLPVISVTKSELCDFRVPNSHVRRLREADFGTDCSKKCPCERLILGNMCSSGGQESAQLSRLLDVLSSLCENTVNSGIA